ncbi:MAG: acyl-[ACP]--phospholipid O-acyltransferase, partial [Deltaproteobacteria bacterium]
KAYLQLDYLRQNLSQIISHSDIWLSILGISIFWGMSQTLLVAFPAHFKMLTGSDNAAMANLILSTSILGLIVGSFLAGSMSKRHIALGLIPFGSIGMFGALAWLMLAQTKLAMAVSIWSFGFFGGLFIIPLNSAIQYFAPPAHEGRILSGSNFFQNIAMLGMLVLSSVLIYAGANLQMLFAFMSLALLILSIYTIVIVPHLFARLLIYPILKTKYALSVEGLENIPQSGGVLLIGNHISWIDWLVLQIASPRAIKFVIYRKFYEFWYLKWFLRLFKVIPISEGASKQSLENIAQRLKNGEVVAIFGEGHISYNGQINTFAKGFERAVQDVDCAIVPFYLRGLWGSSFSRASKYYKELTQRRGRREIIVAFGKALPSTTSAEQARQAVIELSFIAWDVFLERQSPLMHNWLRNAKTNLFKTCAVDPLMGKTSNLKFITAVLIFIDLFKQSLGKQAHVGILLPNSTIASIVNMALFSMGKVPINLNYTLNEGVMAQVLEKSQARHVITSTAFLEKLQTKGFDYAQVLGDKALRLEDLRQRVEKASKIKALIFAFMPQ